MKKEYTNFHIGQLKHGKEKILWLISLSEKMEPFCLELFWEKFEDAFVVKGREYLHRMQAIIKEILIQTLLIQ